MGGGVKKPPKTRSLFLLRSLSFPFIVAEQLYASCCDLKTNDSYWLRAGGNLQVQGCWYWMSWLDEMWLEEKQEEDGGVAADRSKAGVMLPSHWVTTEPWGERWGCGRWCACVCVTVEAGIEYESSMHYADSTHKVIGWEKTCERERSSDWSKKAMRVS